MWIMKIGNMWNVLPVKYKRKGSRMTIFVMCGASETPMHLSEYDWHFQDFFPVKMSPIISRALRQLGIREGDFYGFTKVAPQLALLQSRHANSDNTSLPILRDSLSMFATFARNNPHIDFHLSMPGVVTGEYHQLEIEPMLNMRLGGPGLQNIKIWKPYDRWNTVRSYTPHIEGYGEWLRM